MEHRAKGRCACQNSRYWLGEKVMWHPLVDVVGFAQVGTYTLKVRFDDGAEQTIHFEPGALRPGVRPATRPGAVRLVRLDPECATAPGRTAPSSTRGHCMNGRRWWSMNCTSVRKLGLNACPSPRQERLQPVYPIAVKHLSLGTASPGARLDFPQYNSTARDGSSASGIVSP